MTAMVLSSVANHIWQSTLFAALAALLALALRRNQARVRCWLWLAASYKFLVPFSLLVSIGSLFPWRTTPVLMPHAVATVTDFVSDPAFLTTTPAVQPVADHAGWLIFALWMVWGCGLVVVLMRWMREWLRIRAIVRGASPLQMKTRIGPYPTLCHSEPRRSLPGRGICFWFRHFSEKQIPHSPRRMREDNEARLAMTGVRVVSTPEPIEPGVFGILRPVLLLPEGIADRLTPDQLQAVVAHELCHVRRRDNLTAAIHMLVEAMFWFYPVVWWLGARIIDERERACDEEVLRAGSQSQAYAESILRVCEFYLESPLTCVSGISGSDLKKRIQRILREHFGVALSTRKKFLLAAAAVMAVASPVLIGMLTAPKLRAQTPEQPAKPVALHSSDVSTAIDDMLRAQAQIRQQLARYVTVQQASLAAVIQRIEGSQQGPESQAKRQTTANRLSFEIASIKPDHSGTNPVHFGLPPGRFTATNVTTKLLIAFAFNGKQGGQALRDNQISGGPAWIASERYDIDAKVEDAMLDEEKTLPLSDWADQVRLMVQSLLADRFKLMVSHETREFPAYALLPAKNGARLSVSTVPQPGPVTSLHPPQPGSKEPFLSIRGGQISGVAMTIGALADALSRQPELGGREVIDMTGLKATYDFMLHWTPEIAGPPVPSANGAPPADTSGPSLFTALQEQLGLRLESTKALADVVVINHIEAPTPN